jgi:hypothetical protein
MIHRIVRTSEASFNFPDLTLALIFKKRTYRRVGAHLRHIKSSVAFVAKDFPAKTFSGNVDFKKLIRRRVESEITKITGDTL